MTEKLPTDTPESDEAAWFDNDEGWWVSRSVARRLERGRNCYQKQFSGVLELVSKLKSLNKDYDVVGITAAKTPGKWPFASEAEVKLRRDASRISFEIMQVERQIITELLK